jgi:purine nucleoside phosphorylase
MDDIELKDGFDPEIGIVLGSGLHDEVEEISAKVSDKLIRLLKVTVKKMSAAGQ